ncbi:divalent metal cation transporter [Gemmatimonas groenlandica]|uniref:Divalent metal cation transporter n=2 Tax=Gemmatimonas groenlandica TaxID=2732249 RepID=A0A6M4IUE1_9BACT|nr:divalent metal cation transporter [Gemmatimonas groenlandica]
MRVAGASALASVLAVLGPGLLAGLSDDDPAGITTYSILGAEHGYRLLWIIPASTILLVQFHLVAVRIGAATGKGFVAVVRERWGRTWGYAAVFGLVFANFGTICAEYAGVAAAGSLIGLPAWLSAIAAGTLITLVVVLGSFARVEKVLLAISATLALYVVDGILAGPVWAEVAYGSVVPRMPVSRDGWIALAASLGTTLAPWGLAFIQSYAVDKKITMASLRWERVDVVVGSALTGIVGLAIAVACAATLHQAGVHIVDAGDAAAALRPLAGSFATLFFGVGLLGSSLLAAAIVPIATSYSIAEGVGEPASLDLDSKHFHWFYAAFVGLTVAGVGVVAVPGLPLIQLIYSSQVLNAVMLPLHIVALLLLAGNAEIMGSARSSTGARFLGWISFVLVLACLGGMAWSWIG